MRIREELHLNEVLYLLITACTSVVALFLIAKLLGKKQVAQLNFVDYVIGISIGSIASEMATDISDKPLYYYLIALAVYLLFDVVINFLGRKTPALKHFFKGRPIVIVYEGKINYANLKKSKLAVNDLICLCRCEGYFDITQIEYAILEDNGQLSIMPKGAFKPVTTGDVSPQPPQAQLPSYLVIDGRISYSSLNELGRTTEWLMRALNIPDDKDLSDVILAVYDSEHDNVIVSFK